MADIREPRIGDVAEIANAMQLAAAEGDKDVGRTVFFIGAGCSKSAGIPMASDIARQLVLRLAKSRKAPMDALKGSEEAYRWLASNKGFTDCRVGEPPKNGDDTRGIDWPRVYDVLFAEHYKTPDHAREIFSDLVDQAEGRINWAHLCLGELVKQKLVSTVITTNFDQLVLAGMVQSGVLPVVCDGFESLTRIRGAPRHAQLVELHGSRHTYRLRNAPHEIEAVISEEQAIAAIASLFQELRVLVVVGYGGREKGIMDLLVRAAGRFSDKQLFWVAHGSDPKQLSEKARALLATSHHSALLVGQDADSFFLRLLKELGIGAPEAVREPLYLASIYAGSLELPDSDEIAEHAVIAAEIDRHRVEIDVMKQALDRHRKNRTATEMAIAQARELRLAGKLAEAMQILEPAAKQGNDRALWRELGEVAYELGENSPDRESLETAIVASRRVLEMAERKSDPLDWAATQNNLGRALWRLGERESRTARLEEAVTAMREALKERIRERVPLDWATTQNMPFGASASARAAPRVSRRPSSPFATPSRKTPVSVYHSNGP